MKRTPESKAAMPTNGSDAGDTFLPSSTLSDYAIEEVTVGKAARLLKSSKHHHFKVSDATNLDSEEIQTGGDVVYRNPLVRPVLGYEVEEIEPGKLAAWMSGALSNKKDDGKG